MGEPGGVLFDAGKCDVSPLLCISTETFRYMVIMGVVKNGSSENLHYFIIIAD